MVVEGLAGAAGGQSAQVCVYALASFSPSLGGKTSLTTSFTICPMHSPFEKKKGRCACELSSLFSPIP